MTMKTLRVVLIHFNFIAKRHLECAMSFLKIKNLSRNSALNSLPVS